MPAAREAESSRPAQPPPPPLPGGEVIQLAQEMGSPQPPGPSPAGEELALVVVPPTDACLMGGEPTGAEELAVAALQTLDDGHTMQWRNGIKRGRDGPAASDSEREPTPHRARGEPPPPLPAQRAHKLTAHASHKGGKAHTHHPHPDASAQQ